jgi:hypothetical protein
MATTTTEAPTTETTNVRPGATPSARNKAAILAELESGGEAATDEPKPKAAAAPAEEPEEVEPEVEASEEGSAPAADPEPEDADDAEKGADADTTKGLDRIKAAEKRMRLELQKDRDAFERERQASAKDVKDAKDAVGELQKLRARAKYDPVALLRWAGVDEADFGDVSRMVYASSPDFAKDPKNKEAVTRLAREKEYADKVRSLEEKQAQLEAERKAEKDNAQAEQAINEYLDDVVKTVKPDAHPVVARLAERSPKQARADLRQIAEVMAQEGGDIRGSNVAAMLEAVMREELEEAGVDVSTLVKAKPKAAATTAKKEDKAAAPVNGKPAVKPNDRRAMRSELLQKLEAGDLE